jgi:hypothetical protein
VATPTVASGNATSQDMASWVDAGVRRTATAASPTRKQVAQAEMLTPPPPGGYLYPEYTAAGTVPLPADSLELDIQQSLQAIEADAATVLAGGASFRIRDGQDGLSRLFQIGIPIETRFSPWYTGTARVAVVPMYLDVGNIPKNLLPQFGTNQILSSLSLPTISPGYQNAAGVGLLASYTYGPYSAQFGTTPVGFPAQNLIGGVAFAPKLYGDLVTLRIEAQRQPVTDTLLSYAGTKANLGAANAATGGAFQGNSNLWGGVTKNGGRVTLAYDDGYYGAFGGGGVSLLVGTSVPENSEVEATIGGYFRPYKSDQDTLRTGIQLVYFGYDRNLGFYSYGQGGYFSPSNYIGLSFPIEYSGRSDRWSYLASVAPGIQHFNSRNSPIYPINPGAQAQLASLIGNAAHYQGGATTGPGVSFRGQVEYALDKDLVAGAAAGFDNGRDYNEGTVKLYLRKTFGLPEMAPVLPSSPAGFPEAPSRS